MTEHTGSLLSSYQSQRDFRSFHKTAPETIRALWVLLLTQEDSHNDATQQATTFLLPYDPAYVLFEYCCSPPELSSPLNIWSMPLDTLQSLLRDPECIRNVTVFG